MTATRRSSLAGSWYPGDRSGCLREIQGYLKERPRPTSPDIKGLGGVVPHAGWYFSGRIACIVFAALADILADPDTVAVIGMHLAPSSPNYIMAEGAWQTPLGEIAIDEGMAAGLVSGFPFQVESAAGHKADNTIELQLPFIKHFFPEAKLLPMGLPPRPESLDVARGLADLAAEKGTRLMVVGSTDLTHYGPNYGFTNMGRGEAAVDWVKGENDRRLVELILKMDPHGIIEEALKNQNACCSGAAASAVAAALRMGAVDAEELFYSTSYDTMPSDSFVGYVGVVF